jgi:hypothetical protein
VGLVRGRALLDATKSCRCPRPFLGNLQSCRSSHRRYLTEARIGPELGLAHWTATPGAPPVSRVGRGESRCDDIPRLATTSVPFGPWKKNKGRWTVIIWRRVRRCDGAVRHRYGRREPARYLRRSLLFSAGAIDTKVTVPSPCSKIDRLWHDVIPPAGAVKKGRSRGTHGGRFRYKTSSDENYTLRAPTAD